MARKVYDNPSDGQPPYGQPSITEVASATTFSGRRSRSRADHCQNLSACGKLVVALFGAATIILCVGMLGTILAPEFPTISPVSASAVGGDHGGLVVTLLFANTNEKGLSYTNVTLQAYSVGAGEETISGASVAALPFRQGGGDSRTVEFGVRGVGNESEVEIEFRARVRYRGSSWPVKPESDIRAKCKRVKVTSSRQRVDVENPNCAVDGTWLTARIVMLGSTLVLPLLVIVFLSVSSCCTSPQH